MNPLQLLLFRNLSPTRLGLPLLLALFAPLLACAPAEGETAAGTHDHPVDQPDRAEVFGGEYPIEIVTTTGMVADVARNVGGEYVDVTALMGEGVDPHLYKASPGDVSLLQGADLILYSGLHLEGKMGDILVKLARQRPTYAVTEAVPEHILNEPPEFQGQYDPHIWFDVNLWSETVQFVRDLLKEFDPDHAEYYQQQAEQYLAELKELDEYVRRRIAEIPEERRVLVTAHDAFGYFGEAYGMEVLAIQGISTESEAGIHKVNELVDTLVERNIKAVFVESSVSDKNIKALIEGARARGHEITIGGSLYSDAMGPEGTPEGTYVGMVHHNVDTIVDALK